MVKRKSKGTKLFLWTLWRHTKKVTSLPILNLGTRCMLSTSRSGYVTPAWRNPRYPL